MTDPSPQEIDTLRDRYEKLSKEKHKNEANLATQEELLEKLQRQAKEAYGTDDVAELAAKLETMKQENEDRRRSYQAKLDAIEANLAKIEEDYATTQGDGQA